MNLRGRHRPAVSRRSLLRFTGAAALLVGANALGAVMVKPPEAFVERAESPNGVAMAEHALKQYSDNHLKAYSAVSPGELAVVERVIYVEMSPFSPEQRPAGVSLEGYMDAYVTAAMNIASVIKNRNVSPDFQVNPGKRNLYHILLQPGEFSGVYMQPFSSLIFKPGSPKPGDLERIAARNPDRQAWAASLDRLVPYLNTARISGDDLAAYGNSPGEQELFRMQTQADLIRKALATEFGNGLASGSLAAEYYKNNGAAKGKVWDGQCVGINRLEWVGSDPKELPEHQRHNYFRIVSRCS